MMANLLQKGDMSDDSDEDDDGLVETIYDDEIESMEPECWVCDDTKKIFDPKEKREIRCTNCKRR